MKKILSNNQSGLAPIAVVLAAVLALALAGGYWWWSKSPSHQASKNEEAINDLKVEKLNMQINLSPLPSLDLSSFNLPVASLGGLNIFSGVAVDTDFSYKGEVKLNTPSYELNVSVPTGDAAEIPASASSAVQSGSAPSATPTSAPSQTGAPAGQGTDCSQFSSVPSCSMVGGGQAYELCKQCFPSK